MSDLVVLSDENELYKLNHYTSCDENSSEEIKNTRGLIYRDNVLMCKTFGFTPEILFTEEKLNEIVSNCINEGYRFFPSFEGTILRLWCDTDLENGVDKWHLSTHKKIDASKSRWGSKFSFRELFLNTLFPQNENKDQSFLDFTTQLINTNCYVFLLRSSTHNRIVCRRETNEIYYLGSFDRSNNFKYNFPLSLNNENIKLISQIEIKDVNDFKNQIDNNINEINNCYETQGIMGINENGDTVKFLNPEYWRNTVLRGSEPNVILRYIELLKQRDFETIIKLKELYNEVEEFNFYDNTMEHIKKNLLGKYIKRYINKSVAIVPPEQHRILCDLYNLYLSNPEGNRLNMNLIENYLNQLDNNLLHNLYRQYQKRRALYGNGNWVNTETKDKVLSVYYKEDNTSIS